MKLTKEEAVRLFHEQWSDMQKELGDCPCSFDRDSFKREWCKKKFPDESIANDCFLCEYVEQADPGYFTGCYRCPIAWPLNMRGMPSCSLMPYLYAPISKILELAVREGV